MREFLKDKKRISFIIILGLFLFLLYAAYMFINAFLGALVLFVISRPLYTWLRSKKFSRGLAAWLIIIISLLLIIIPLFFMIQGLTQQISVIPQTIANMETFFNTISEYLPFDIDIDKEKIVDQIVPFLQKVLTPIFSNIIKVIANIVLFYFLLYYMLVHDDKFINNIRRMLPFSETNRTRVINRFAQITKATLIGSLLIALVQGGMLAIGFYVLGINGALFWGFVTAILSFIPIIGSPLIWGPATIFLLLSGDITKAILLIVWGIIISSVDNFIRPYTNKKFGQIHPLVSIIGVFIGLAQFGFIGIFVGPLLVSYFILFWKIYKKEYLG